jgi:AcrR family transcriptional regulator
VSDLSGDDTGEARHMNKNPQRTEQTRQDLIDAFWSLYCKKSIEKISVKEVAAKAGYNRGTFYEYFTDVYSLLRQLELSLLPSSPEELPPRSAASVKGTGQPLDLFIKMYERNQKYFVVLLGEHGDPAFQGRIKRHMRPMLQSVLAAGRGTDKFEIEVIIEFVLSAMIGVLSYWFSCEQKPPSEKLLSLMYDLMGNGALHRLKA